MRENLRFSLLCMETAVSVELIWNRINIELIGIHAQTGIQSQIESDRRSDSVWHCMSIETYASYEWGRWDLNPQQHGLQPCTLPG